MPSFSFNARRDDRRLAAQADLLLALSRALDVPGEQTFRKMEQLVLRAEELMEAAGIRDERVLSALREMLSTAEAADIDDWQDEYQRMFDQTETVAGEFAPVEHAEIVEAMSGAGHSAELAKELEMFSSLLRIRAQAARAGNQEGVKATSDALGLFVRYHIGARLPALCASLSAPDTFPIYAQLAAALRMIWNEIITQNELTRPN